MKIGIDIDDTLVEFNNNLVKFYNKFHNTNFNFKDICTGKLDNFFEISLEKAIQIVKEFYFSEDFKNVGFVEGARESVVFLSKSHDILFITARHTDFKEKTNLFFRKSFQDYFCPKIIFSSDEWNEGKEKHELCVGYGVDLIIEDRLEYALKCANKGIKTFLLDKPWNQIENLPLNIIRIKNWKEILEKIIGVENEN